MNNALWKSAGLPRGRIFLGLVKGKNQVLPGAYVVDTTDGFEFNDAVPILNHWDNASNAGDYVHYKIGSTVIVVTTNDGCMPMIIGCVRLPRFVEESDESMPVLDHDQEAPDEGDRVIQTAGGARLILRDGGMAILEGGAGATSITMDTALPNSLTKITARSPSWNQVNDGYQVYRGRPLGDANKEQTSSREDFFDKVGPSSVRVSIRHGNVTSTVRRELTVSSVTQTKLGTTGTIKLRERYYADGSWVGEGAKYQWGDGADEPFVLGKQLVSVMEQLIDKIKTLQVNTAWGPSGPPLPNIVADLETLKASLSGKILSTYLFGSKTSKPPGTVNE